MCNYKKSAIKVNQQDPKLILKKMHPRKIGKDTLMTGKYTKTLLFYS